jgi:hypothetical protein
VHHPGLAWWAVGTAITAVVMIALGLTVLGRVGFNANDEDFDNWKGAVVTIGLFGGVGVSVVAFALAVVEKVRHDRWALLWLPLLFGPLFIITMPLWFE